MFYTSVSLFVDHIQFYTTCDPTDFNPTNELD